MLAAVSCLLVIACLNLANLLGARVASRTREFTVRPALGASRARLTLPASRKWYRSSPTSGLAGVAAANAAIAAFVPIAPATLPRVESIAVNGPVLAFSAGILLLTSLVAGVLPAMHAWRSNVLADGVGHTVVDGDTRPPEDAQRARGRAIRVRTALLVAGTALRPQLHGAHGRQPGFRQEDVLSMHLAIFPNHLHGRRAGGGLCGRIVERMRAGRFPGIVAAGMVNRLPLAGGNQVLPFEFEHTTSRPTPLQSRSVTPDYSRR